MKVFYLFISLSLLGSINCLGMQMQFGEKKEYMHFQDAILKEHFAPRLSLGEKKAREILKENKQLVKYKSKTQKTPLMLASELARADIVNILLEFEARIDEQDHTGNSALHYVIRAVLHPSHFSNDGYLDLFAYQFTIKKLLHAGANPYLKNNAEKSFVDLLKSDDSIKKKFESILNQLDEGSPVFEKETKGKEEDDDDEKHLIPLQSPGGPTIDHHLNGNHWEL